MNIVFDFGNVLFEWNPAALIEQHFPGADQLGVDYVEFATAMATHSDWLAFDAGHLDAKTLAPRVASRMRVDLEAVHTFLGRLPHVLRPIESAIEIVERLCARHASKHRVYYLSNMPAEYADTLERKYPWIAKFHGGVFSGRVGLTKPDPAIYRLAERTCNLRPSETLFLDDSGPNVVAAQACGWHAAQILDASDVGRALEAHDVRI
jgi:putative hydrolase of the HAD superfamily